MNPQSIEILAVETPTEVKVIEDSAEKDKPNQEAKSSVEKSQVSPDADYEAESLLGHIG